MFDTGAFYSEIDILFNEPNEYFLTSYDDKMRHLVEMYGDDIFGILDKAKAQGITTRLLAQRYKREVL